MKKLILLFLVLLPNMIIAQIDKGNWYWNSDNRNDRLEFYIKSVNDKTIKGNYCSVFNNGNKIDCSSDFENETNFILKKTSKNTYQGIFKSNFSSTEGIMKIVFDSKNNKIELEIVKDPKGEYYLPKNAVLSQ